MKAAQELRFLRCRERPPFEQTHSDAARWPCEMRGVPRGRVAAFVHRFGFLVALLLFVLVAPIEAKTDITFATLRLPDGEIRFTTRAERNSSASETDILKRDAAVATTRDNKFRLYIDLASATARAGSHYAYDAFVCNATDDDQSCDPFKIMCTPVGAFADSWRDVEFSILDGAQPHAGGVKIPVHSFTSKDPLTLPGDFPASFDVSVGSETSIALNFRNVLEDTKIAVDPKPTLRADDPALWDLLVAEPARPVLTVSQGTSNHAFTIRVRPNLFHALVASIAPRRLADPQTKLSLALNYRAEYGGNERPLEIVLPVRLLPSIWSLFVVVIGGSFAGVAFCSLLPSNSKSTVTPRAVAAAAAFGVIAEMISILFVVGGSKLVVFGLELNPSQLLTAFLVGFASGLTVVWKSDSLRVWFGRWVKNAEVEVRQ